jgi:crossover junction endodeoxyribonuclease RusA
VTTFTVFGTPVPKGSMKSFWKPGMKRAVITHDNKNTRPWQEAVVDAARVAVGERPPIEEPVELELLFLLPRPKSAPRRVTQPGKKPDLDKLVRCVKDGLTRAGVYRDDALVIRTVTEKHFAGGLGDPAGPAGIPRAIVRVAVYAVERGQAGELFARAEGA